MLYTNKDKNILLRTWKEEYDKALQHYNEKIKDFVYFTVMSKKIKVYFHNKEYKLHDILNFHYQ